MVKSYTTLFHTPLTKTAFHITTASYISSIAFSYTHIFQFLFPLFHITLFSFVARSLFLSTSAYLRKHTHTKNVLSSFLRHAI